MASARLKSSNIMMVASWEKTRQTKTPTPLELPNQGGPLFATYFVRAGSFCLPPFVRTIVRPPQKGILHCRRGSIIFATKVLQNDPPAWNFLELSGSLPESCKPPRTILSGRRPRSFGEQRMSVFCRPPQWWLFFWFSFETTRKASSKKTNGLQLS